MKPDGPRTSCSLRRCPRCGRSAATSALNGGRLCGSVQVIDAAEKLVTAAGDLDLNERKADRFQLQAKAVVAAQKTFLDTFREKLFYNARWYQILRRRKEKRFLRQLTAG